MAKNKKKFKKTNGPKNSMAAQMVLMEVVMGWFLLGVVLVIVGMFVVSLIVGAPAWHLLGAAVAVHRMWTGTLSG